MRLLRISVCNPSGKGKISCDLSRSFFRSIRRADCLRLGAVVLLVLLDADGQVGPEA